jgi:hypothetical protein
LFSKVDFVTAVSVAERLTNEARCILYTVLKWFNNSDTTALPIRAKHKQTIVMAAVIEALPSL